MLSYDYCHFEIALSTDDTNCMISDKGVNEMRKAAQRLADEAVRQYKVAKRKAAERDRAESNERFYHNDLERILSKPESDRTPDEKALIKRSEDEDWQKRYNYDYEDDEYTPDFDD
jgi:hypothetical protein